MTTIPGDDRDEPRPTEWVPKEKERVFTHIEIVYGAILNSFRISAAIETGTTATRDRYDELDTVLTFMEDEWPDDIRRYRGRFPSTRINIDKMIFKPLDGST